MDTEFEASLATQEKVHLPTERVSFTEQPPNMVDRYLSLLRDALLNRHYASAARAPLSASERRAALTLLGHLRAFFRPWLERHPTHPEADEVTRLIHCTADDFALWLRENSVQAMVLQQPSGLDNVRSCVETVLQQGVPGDLMECGTWRGGVTVFMNGLLKAHGDLGRKVWVLDSFQGLPVPNQEECPLDYLSYEALKLVGGFSTSLEDVRGNFQKFDLLDEQVRFVPGWFADTVPALQELDQLAVLRLDADFYESTVVLLEHLYPKLSVGGFIIVDDYGISHMGARRAVDEYRERHEITQPMIQVNPQTYFWQKLA